MYNTLNDSKSFRLDETANSISMLNSSKYSLRYGGLIKKSNAGLLIEDALS